jgi:tetratricopeptide (TPR) repeat protein
MACVPLLPALLAGGLTAPSGWVRSAPAQGAPTDPAARAGQERVPSPASSASEAEFLRKGAALREAQKPLEALDVFLRGVAACPRSARLRLEAGRLLEDLEKRESAERHFVAALEIDPVLAPALIALGVLRSEAGRLDDAHRLLEAAVKAEPASAAAHQSLSVVLERLGRLDGALEHAQRAVELAPREGRAFASLGSALEKLGRLEEALQAFEEGARAQPDYAPVRYKLSLLCARLGRAEEAARQRKAFRELKARDHLEKAEGLVRGGELRSAARECERALDAEPDCVDAHARLGALYLRQGEPARAVTHARRAFELDPRPSRQANLSWALLGAGKKDEALDWIERALKAEPERREFLEQRKVILATTPKE